MAGADEQELEAGEVVRRVPRSAVQVSLEFVDCGASVVADTDEDEAGAAAAAFKVESAVAPPNLYQQQQQTCRGPGIRPLVFCAGGRRN